MKKREAIERIKNHMEIHKLKEPRAIYITTALYAGINALEKQIPRTVIISDDGDSLPCPTCNEDLMGSGAVDSDKDISYCPYCGQALGWI